MNTTSPFSFLESIATRFQPPAWVVNEGQQRLVLFLNHVLLQEKQAQDRLLGQKGRVVHLRWGLFAIDLIVTPAGLVDRAPALSMSDLVLSVAAESPLAVVQAVLSGKAPPVKIEGDVQLAAEIGWLAENLRWDAEEDLSRLIGDVPAHALGDVGRRLASGLKQFLAQGPSSSPANSTAPVVPVPPTAQGRPVRDRANGVASESAREPTQVDPALSDNGDKREIKSGGTQPAPKASA
ncbi:MAG: hypothetical protein ABIQ90_13590 [Polaromonas sp.]